MAVGAASVEGSAPARIPPLAPCRRAWHRRVRSPDRRGRSQVRRRGALGSSAGPWSRRGTAAGDLL